MGLEGSRERAFAEVVGMGSADVGPVVEGSDDVAAVGEVEVPVVGIPGLVRGRSCSEWESISWVADNVGFDSVDLSGCPSDRAYSLWVWARSSSVNMGRFWERLYPLITPTKEMMDSEARKRDDGEADIRRIDELLEALGNARREAEVRRGGGGDVSAPWSGTGRVAGDGAVASGGAPAVP